MNARRRTVLMLVTLVLATAGSFLLAWFFAEANLLSGLDKVFSVIGGISGIAAVYLGWMQRGPLTGHIPGRALSQWSRSSVAVPDDADGEQIRGRDSLIAELTGMFDQRATNSPRVWVLHGMGGVGKTTVAEHVGRLLAAKDVTAWEVDAANENVLNVGMRDIAKGLKATDYELGDGWGPDVLWRLLAAYPKPWLLIVDNADDLTLLSPVGQKIANGQGWIRPVGATRGAIIVTSRDNGVDQWGKQWETWCQRRRVDVLSAIDGAQILLDLADTTTAGTREDAYTLAERLGGLPLALRLAGRYLGQTKDEDPVRGQPATFADIRSALDADGVDAAFPDPGRQPADRRSREVIALTWELSLTHLETVDGLSHTRNLLRLLAVFADTPVSQDLLDAVVMADSGLFPRMRPIRLDESRDGLIRFGLIDVKRARPETQTPATWHLHPLIRDASLYHLGMTGQTSAFLALAARLLKRAVDEHENQFDSANWPFYRLVSPHPIHVLTRAAESPGPEDQETIATAADVASAASRYLAVLGQHHAAAEQATTIRSITIRALGDDHPTVVHASADLASFTGGYGDAVSSRDQYAALVPVAERVLGVRDPASLLLYRSNLGWAIGEAGDPIAARDYLATLLPAATELLAAAEQSATELELEETIHAVAATRSNHARFVGEAGDAMTARDLYIDVLPLTRRVHGDTGTETLKIQARIANWTGRAGAPLAAHELLETLVEIMKKSLGPHHSKTLLARSDLAYWTGRIGDPAAARNQFASLPEMFESAIGPEHPDTLKSRVHLAYWTGWAGSPKDARDQLTELLPVLQRVLGTDHRVALVARADLAQWTGRSGDPTGARDQLAELLPDLQHVFGTEDSESFKVRGNLDYWSGRS